MFRHIVLVNGRVKVDYDERRRRLTCPQVRAMLTRFKRALIRTRCPITIHKWKYIPRNVKHEEQLSTEFDIGYGEPQTFDYIYGLRTAQFKEWMFKLRNYYADKESHQRALNNPPNEFQNKREQWTWLCEFFDYF
nr:uncharacterized protein LOC114825209 [Malus domestica]